MYLLEWEVVATKTNESQVYGPQLPMLAVKLSGDFECPVCKKLLTKQRTYQVTVYNEVGWQSQTIDIDSRWPAHVSVLCDWLFGERRCPQCGVSSAVPDDLQPSMRTEIEGVLSKDWVLNQMRLSKVPEVELYRKFGDTTDYLRVKPKPKSLVR